MQMPPQQAVAILKRCGALVSLAHPGLIACSHDELKSLTASLKDHGLDALEVFHSSHDAQEVSFLHGMAERLGLAVTGGSDFHGSHKPHIRLGHVQYGSDGKNRISRTIYEALIKYRRTGKM
jgi:predicted metal-dependent phosphoesterase TrpH